MATQSRRPTQPPADAPAVAAPAGAVPPAVGDPTGGLATFALTTIVRYGLATVIAVVLLGSFLYDKYQSDTRQAALALEVLESARDSQRSLTQIASSQADLARNQAQLATSQAETTRTLQEINRASQERMRQMDALLTRVDFLERAMARAK